MTARRPRHSVTPHIDGLHGTEFVSGLTGHHQSRLKEANRALVLRVLMRGPRSRRNVARATGLTSAAITNIVGHLVNEGMVIETGEDRTNTSVYGGRPAITLDLNPDGPFVLGAQVGVTEAVIARANLRGAVQESVTIPLSGRVTPEEFVDRCRSAADRLSSRQRILGLGVGIAGVVETDKGHLVSMPQLGWQDVPLRQLLEARFRWPIAIDNNVSAMALAELLLGGPNLLGGDFCFVYVGNIVRAALVLHGDLYRGHSHAAGQIGHLQVEDNGTECICGRRGCLETIIGDSAFTSRARRAAEHRGQSAVGKTLESTTDTRTIVSRIAELAIEGDALATDLMNEKARALARAMAVTSDVVDPPAFVVASSIRDDLQWDWLARITRAFDQDANLLKERRSQVIATTFGAAAPIVAACALALRGVFQPRRYG